MKGNGKYPVKSNRESGTGRPDIVLKTPSVQGRAIVIEIKAANSLAEMEKGCQAALAQIHDKQYMEGIRQEGYQDVCGFGMCFWRKEALVKRAGL